MGGVLAFVQEGGFVSSAAVPLGELGTEDDFVVRRDPQLHEKVVVVVNKGGDHYLTRETSVRQVGVGGKTFFLQATDGNVCSLASGMVISVQDGAFLGLFLRDTVTPTVGRLSMCVPVASRPSSAVVMDLTLEEAVQRKLSMVHVDAWQVELLHEAFRLPVPSNAGLKSCDELAVMGRTMLQSDLQASLRSARINVREWETYADSLLNDSKLAGLLVDLGLYEYVQGVEEIRSSDLVRWRADVMAALIQVVVLMEKRETVESVTAMLGLVPLGFSRGPHAEYGALMRRPSEYAFKHMEDDGSIRLISPID